MIFIYLTNFTYRGQQPLFWPLYVVSSSGSFVNTEWFAQSYKAQTLWGRRKSNGGLPLDMWFPLSSCMALFVRKVFFYQGLESFLSGDSTGERAKGQLTREMHATCQLATQSCSQTPQRKINWLPGRNGQWKSNKLLKLARVCPPRMGKTCLQIFLSINFKSTCTKNCKHF